MDNQTNQADPAQQIYSQFKSGANWFYWIAGLSIVNSAILYFGGGIAFIFGLGITQLIDGIGMAIAQEYENIGNTAQTITFVLSVFVSSIFVLFGYFANRLMQWAFIVGMVLYALDAVLCLVFSAFLDAAVHAFVLYCLFNGFKACRILVAAQKMADTEDQNQQVIEIGNDEIEVIESE